MSDQLLAAVTQYGAPALFAIVAIAAVGVPLPITLLLIVAGSMVSQGAMDLWLTLAVASVGSILGDQAGYAIGRWGGAAAADKVSRFFGKQTTWQSIEAKANAWGGPGIYFTRWLLSPLGPWINLASGAAGYPWHRFLLWDVLGEMTGAAILISLGRYFSDRVMALDAVLGDLTWMIAAALVAVILGVQLVMRYRRRPRPGATSSTNLPPRTTGTPFTST